MLTAYCRNAASVTMLHSAECTASVSHATSAPLCRTPSHRVLPHSRVQILTQCASPRPAAGAGRCSPHVMTQYIHRVPAPRLGDWVTVQHWAALGTRQVSQRGAQYRTPSHRVLPQRGKCHDAVCTSQSEVRTPLRDPVHSPRPGAATG